MRRINEEPTGWFSGRVDGAKLAARARIRDLIVEERRRAQFHISLIRRGEPAISADRIAHTILERWVKVASVEGGVTGAMGVFGVPLNLVLFVYAEIALVVSIAEVYDTPLEGDAGEEAVLGVIGRAHGVEDVLRASPRLLGAVARAVAVRHGFASLGRLVPLIAAPIAAKLNERDMERLGGEALRRFGNVVRIA